MHYTVHCINYPKFDYNTVKLPKKCNVVRKICASITSKLILCAITMHSFYHSNILSLTIVTVLKTINNSFIHSFIHSFMINVHTALASKGIYTNSHLLKKVLQDVKLCCLYLGTNYCTLAFFELVLSEFYSHLIFEWLWF